MIPTTNPQHRYPPALATSLLPRTLLQPLPPQFACNTTLSSMAVNLGDSLLLPLVHATQMWLSRFSRMLAPSSMASRASPQINCALSESVLNSWQSPPLNAHLQQIWAPRFGIVRRGFEGKGIQCMEKGGTLFGQADIGSRWFLGGACVQFLRLCHANPHFITYGLRSGVSHL